MFKRENMEYMPERHDPHPHAQYKKVYLTYKSQHIFVSYSTNFGADVRVLGVSTTKTEHHEIN